MTALWFDPCSPCRPRTFGVFGAAGCGAATRLPRSPSGSPLPPRALRVFLPTSSLRPCVNPERQISRCGRGSRRAVGRWRPHPRLPAVSLLATCLRGDASRLIMGPGHARRARETAACRRLDSRTIPGAPSPPPSSDPPRSYAQLLIKQVAGVVCNPLSREGNGFFCSPFAWA